MTKRAELIKQFRSGAAANYPIATLGGVRHYTSNLRAADRIEADGKRIAELEECLKDWVTQATRSADEIGTLSAKVAELEAPDGPGYWIGLIDAARDQRDKYKPKVERYKELHKAILALEGSEGMTDYKFAQWVIAALTEDKQ